MITTITKLFKEEKAKKENLSEQQLVYQAGLEHDIQFFLPTFLFWKRMVGR